MHPWTNVEQLLKGKTLESCATELRKEIDLYEKETEKRKILKQI